MNKRVIGAALLGLVLPLSACGNGDDEKAAQSISKQMRENSGEGLSFKKSEADCIGEGFVSEIGTENLQKYKIINSNFEATQDSNDPKMSKSDAEKASAVFQDCSDVKAIMIKGFESQGMPAEAKDCVEKELDKKTLDAFLVGLFRGDESAGQDLGQKITSCATAG